MSIVLRIGTGLRAGAVLVTWLRALQLKKVCTPTHRECTPYWIS